MDSEGSLWVGGLHLGEGALASWGVSGPAAAGRELCCAWPSASGTVGPSCGAMRFFMRDSTPPHEGLCVPSCEAMCSLMWGCVSPHVLMGGCVPFHGGLCPMSSRGAVCPSCGAVRPLVWGCVPLMSSPTRRGLGLALPCEPGLCSVLVQPLVLKCFLRFREETVN